MPASRILAALAVLAAVTLAGCAKGAADDGSAGGRTVVATTTQVGDLTSAVAGRRATVRTILDPGADPHAYEPRPSDVRAIGGAQVVVRSGGDLDAWLGDVLRNAGSDALTVTVADELGPGSESRGEDPHWWQDPRAAAIAVKTILGALGDADPDGRAAYESNARGYLRELRALDRAIAACMARIPARRRRLVTDHDALGHYARRYGIEVIGTVIPALSTQAQTSGGEVARLVRTIRSAGVSTIFPERSVNPKLTRAIARDAGAAVGSALYADSLGPPGSPGATYLGSLRANTAALASGFSDGRRRCELPG